MAYVNPIQVPSLTLLHPCPTSYPNKIKHTRDPNLLSLTLPYSNLLFSKFTLPYPTFIHPTLLYPSQPKQAL